MFNLINDPNRTAYYRQAQEKNAFIFMNKKKLTCVTILHAMK